MDNAVERPLAYKDQLVPMYPYALSLATLFPHYFRTNGKLFTIQPQQDGSDAAANRLDFNL